MLSLYVVDGVAVMVWEIATYLAPVMGAVMRQMALWWQFDPVSTHTFPAEMYSTLPPVSPAELTHGARPPPPKSPTMMGAMLTLCVATAADVAVTMSVVVVVSTAVV